MGIDVPGTIDGLGNAVDYLSDQQKRMRRVSRGVQEITGVPFPEQVASGTVRNKKAIIWQVEGLPERLAVPDLTMKINPKNLKQNYTQLINRKRTFGGFIEEHWGEQLDSLSASGESMTFNGPLGLTNEGRRDTEGFRHLDDLISRYRNNGVVYDTRTGKVIAQGWVVMNYDSAIYRGYFESFSINEVAEKPFSLTYDFTFKVTREMFPGRIKSFKAITTVAKSNGIRTDNVLFDIVGIPTGAQNEQ